MSVHEAIAALPVSGNSDKAAIRAMCTRRFVYVLAASEPATSFTAVDPASGIVPLCLAQNNILFLYDAADSTTAHDGVTCLVSADGKRFKSDTVTPPYSVLTRSTSAQPGSPTVGDRYLVPAAATGTDWAGKDNQVAIYTAAGWRFATVPVGRSLYIEDVDARYYRNAGGTWTSGVGSIVLGTNSVHRSNIIGAPLRHLVVNQTTNTPPGSPTVGDTYIVGPVPTGAWVGHIGKLAICESGSSFTIYAPRVGELAYDIANGADYRYSGTAWVSAAGAIIGRGYATYSASANLATAMVYDDTTPLITEGNEIISTSYTMRSVTNRLRLRFNGQASHNTANSIIAVAAFFNAVSAAIKATAVDAIAIDHPYQLSFEHEFVPGTTSAITISVRAGAVSSGQIRFNGTTAGRTFGGVNITTLVLEEIAA